MSGGLVALEARAAAGALGEPGNAHTAAPQGKSPIFPREPGAAGAGAEGEAGMERE